MAEIARIEDALVDIADGRMVILVDDEDRENEGDLVVAASAVTSEHIRFMMREGRGLICLAMTGTRALELGLEPMVSENTAPLGTAFTRSIDLREAGGVSATGRARTIEATVDPTRGAVDFVTPGFVFPLRARDGGVLVRTGQTEGSVDLARLAGHAPAGVICEIMSPDGTMMRLKHLLAFGERHGIKVITVADLVRYRLSTEQLVRCVSESDLPTEHGTFRMRCFENVASGQVHVTLSIGEPFDDEPTLVRVHRGDTVADVLQLPMARSRETLTTSLERMSAEGSGVLLYLRPEGLEEPLDQRVKRYGALARGEPVQEDSGEAGMGFHDFGIGAQILRSLGLQQIRVISSRPRPFKGLSGYDLEIVGWETIDDAQAS